ncbi:MAG: OmpH family outer membrane protein [Rickettsiaceae bacterium]|nr:OmpH family outer membrane protein [Rickettsiaceae bacterium]
MSKYSLQIITLFLALSSFCSDAFAFKSPAKIAVVNVQSIMDNSTAMIDVRASTENIAKDLQSKFAKIQADLHAEEKNIMELKDKLKPEEFEVKATAFDAKVTKAQKSMQEEKLKLEQAHATAINEVNEIALKIIESISKRHGVDLVLPSTNVLYASESLNITKEVLDKMNQTIPKIKLKL